MTQPNAQRGDKFIEEEFIPDLKMMFKEYMNGVDGIQKHLDGKVKRHIKNETLKKAYDSKAAKITRSLVAAGACMAVLPVAHAAMFSSSPSDDISGKMFAVLGGAVTVGCLAGTAVNLTYAAKEAYNTKMGRAFVHGCKNGAEKMNGFAKAKIFPFVKSASKRIKQEAQNYFGKGGMDVYGARKDGKSGTEYRGTILDNGKKVTKPMTWLRDRLTRAGR